MNYHLAKYVASYGTSSQLPGSEYPEVSFVGRSNVGKSSLMNKLFNRKDLVKVSSVPGKTSTINFFSVGSTFFIDLPGYGFAKTAKSEKGRWSELIDGYFSQDRRFALIVVLIDIRHDVSELDRGMVEFLNGRDLPYIIAFTKADKLSKARRHQQVAKLCRQLTSAADACVVICSSLDGTGIGDLRRIIDDAVRQAG